MYYSIGEVAKLTGIRISTLRYYDHEGMFPDMERCSGIRVFTEKEIRTLRVIECLKQTGMSLKKIKEFLALCAEGDAALDKRRALIYEQLEEARRQASELEKVIHHLEYKCWYYDTAVEAGTEAVLKNLTPPEHLKPYQI